MRRLRDRAKSALQNPLLAQFIKFGIVGVSNTLLTFVIYTILVKAFDVWYLAASATGFTIGSINGFLLNRRWTFREHTGDALTPVRWFVVQALGLGANLGIVYVAVDGLHLDKLVGQALATGIVVMWTFFANRSWTFRAQPQGAGVR
jgi:putative flippase GtrA